jgi:hypothetical protein
MREFLDGEARAWIASVAEQEGADYKGRYHLVLTPRDDGDAIGLEDVRWNSERTARRSIETMSLVELRRRLRSADGRSAPARTG